MMRAERSGVDVDIDLIECLILSGLELVVLFQEGGLQLVMLSKFCRSSCKSESGHGRPTVGRLGLLPQQQLWQFCSVYASTQAP